MIKLVACDLDGTLFNSNIEISSENIQAIRDAQDSGIEFLVATGRAPKQSREIIRKVNLQTSFINLNGALAYDQNDTLYLKHVIPNAKAKQIVSLLKKRGFYFDVFTTEHSYTESLEKRINNIAYTNMALDPKLTFEKAHATAAKNKVLLNTTEINSFEELLNNNIEVMKIIAFDPRGYKAFVDIKKEIVNLHDLSVTSSSAANIEINSQKAQKGRALLDYAQIKGLKRSEIAAIGDNLNDESMIREAGTGVAMGNAIEKIKKIAQVETKTNNENGVAYILRKFIAANAQE